MTVKKKKDLSINNFIARGAQVKSNRGTSFKNILVRIPESLLTELDELLEDKPWLTRTPWIVEAINEKLKREIDEK